MIFSFETLQTNYQLPFPLQSCFIQLQSHTYTYKYLYKTFADNLSELLTLFRIGGEPPL